MSAPDWRDNVQLFAARSKTKTTIGIYRGDIGGLAQVDIGDSTIPVKSTTRYKPQPGEGVALEFHGNTCRMTGPTASHSKLGTVVAVGHPNLTVQCDGKQYSLPFTVSYENSGSGPAVGDTVAIDWDGNYVVDAVTGTNTSTAPPKLTTAQKKFTIVFSAKQSGSFKTTSGTWNSTTGDLYCDSKHSAGWYYGTTINRSLKNDAYIDSVEIFLSVRTKKGDHPKLGRHYDATEQSGGVSVNDAITRAWTGWVALPTDWANGWRSAVGGVSISGGESIYRGIGTDRHSGAIRIRGRQ